MSFAYSSIIYINELGSYNALIKSDHNSEIHELGKLIFLRHLFESKTVAKLKVYVINVF